LTADPTGQVLPSQFAGRAGWTLERSVALRTGEGGRGSESIRATLAAIAKHGFYLTHAAIPATPLDQIIAVQNDSQLAS
jgi:hypothetical protein